MKKERKNEGKKERKREREEGKVYRPNSVAKIVSKVRL